MDLNTTRAMLGHSSLDSTKIYADIGAGTKAGAIELCVVAEPRTYCPWTEYEGLMAFLDGI